ncbi:MAG: oligosaccharide flippase family protein [Candidatus Daviesbacteria bacterium]|nr:oligosaccharide flippase family protein [Candidatus Daviesbacteria bacterium]
MDVILQEKNELKTMDESVEQIDPTKELTTEIIKTRAVKGAAILTGRMVLMQGISFFSMALLTAFLSPAEFGVYFVVSAVKNFLAYFGDIGFAPALIQKQEKPTDLELKTIFTAQQLLILILLGIGFLLTFLIQNIYNLNQAAIYLFWALLFSLFFSSLKTIPTVLLERKLEFNKWVIPQIIENIIFNLTAVTLAWKGFGVTSYTVAVLLSGFIGLFVTYIVQPWLPGIAFSVKSFKSILKFGIPYQANTLLAMVKDDGMTLFLGGVLGPSGVGFLGWAQKWAYAPLRFFMDQVIKVTFPAFSRLQDNRKDLSDLVSKSIFFICILVFPSLVMLVLVTPSLVQVIPKYIKWSPAVFALSVLTINSGLAAITTPLTNTLNAIGKITLTFKLMIMWTILTWIFVPALAVLYGVNGAAVGFAIVGLSSVIALYLVSKHVDINYLQSVGKPVLASIFMGICVFIISSLFSVSWQQIIGMVVAGLISYSLTIFMLEPKLPLLIKNQFRRK